MKARVWVWVFLLTSLGVDSAAATTPVRIANGPRPSQTIRNWHLKEVWRAGGANDEVFFGRILDVAADETGNTYLLDYQQQETYVFGPTGKYLGVRGARGEGPGETTMASKLLVGSDRLGLMNRYPAEIVWLDLKGDPVGKVSPVKTENAEAILGCWWSRLWADRLFWAVTVSTFGKNGISDTYHIAECEPEGRITSIFLTLDEDAYTHGSSAGAVNEGLFFNPLVGRWDVDPQGRIWVAPERDQYLLRVLDAEGRTVMETGREFEPPVRSAAEIRMIRRKLEGPWEESGLPVIVGQHSPCVEKLWIAENPWGDEVWVESGASHFDLPPGVMVRYDLFDLEGNFTHQVDIVGDGDPLFDRWYLAGTNRLIMVRNASPGGYEEGDPAHPRLGDDLLEVICYRILWEE